MKSKWILIIAGCVAFLATLTIFNGAIHRVITDGEFEGGEAIYVVEEQIFSPPINASNLIVSYGDIVATLEELKTSSELIVTATAIDSESRSTVADAITLTVTEVHKGASPKELIVLQAKGDTLKRNGTYILFLGKQEGGDTDHEYYIKGGTQGIVMMDGDGNIRLRDRLLSRDFDKQFGGDASLTISANSVEIGGFWSWLNEE